MGIDSGPDGLTNDPTPTFNFHSGEVGATVECSIDTGTAGFGPCSGSDTHTPAAPLTDGFYTFRVRATDAATNQATATRNFQVDTAAPPAPQLSATVPASPANDNTPQVVGSAPAGTTVRLFSGADCSGSPIATVTPAQLEAGVEVSVADDSSTSFRATATTAAENASGCSEPLTYVEDSSSPQTQIESSPPALTNSASASFSFSGSDAGGSGVASFQCRRDSANPADWAACSSPQSYSSLADGAHSFEVRAVDQAGNADQSAASFEWTIDTTAPDTQIDAQTGGADQQRHGLLQLQRHRHRRLRRRLLPVPPRLRQSGRLGQPAAHRPATARSPTAPTASKSARVDQAGNADQSADSFEWSIDTTAPDTQITLKPAALTNSASASFSFSGTDAGGSGVASFQCRRDSAKPADWAACSSPQSYSSLADGAHSFEVRAIDHAGNADQSADSFEWTIDTAPPLVAIDSLSKSLLKAGESSEVSWHANENGAFSLRLGGSDCDSGTVLDSGAYGSQPASHISNVSAADLSEGANTLRLCLSDAAANRGADTETINKDTIAPDTTIDTQTGRR